MRTFPRGETAAQIQVMTKRNAAHANPLENIPKTRSFKRVARMRNASGFIKLKVTSKRNIVNGSQKTIGRMLFDLRSTKKHTMTRVVRVVHVMTNLILAIRVLAADG